MSVRAMKWAYGLFEVIDMPTRERAVLLALCWDHTDKGGCFPSHERISKMSGVRVRAVQDVVKILEAQGLITRKRVKSGGKFTRTEYTLFGVMRRSPPADGGRWFYRQKKAGGDHRRTGADYRGDNTKGDVIEFSPAMGVKNV